VLVAETTPDDQIMSVGGFPIHVVRLQNRVGAAHVTAIFAPTLVLHDPKITRGIDAIPGDVGARRDVVGTGLTLAVGAILNGRLTQPARLP